MFDENDTLKILKQYETSAMHSQPEVIWKRADKYWVYDEQDRPYIDFTSGVLIANAGHNHPEIIKRIEEQLGCGVLTSYTFPNKPRAELLVRLSTLFPAPDYKAALFNTGSEAVEACIKAAFNWSTVNFNGKKNNIISFENAFHGRTMAAQYVGGIKTLKNWLPPSEHFIQFPYPDNFYCKELSFDFFLQIIKQRELHPNHIAAVLIEPYQGGICSFAPQDYMTHLSQWCTKHQILLIVDEVQSGFGRTGKWWGYEHFKIKPDLIAAGKGISSSLPLSAMIGRADVLDSIPIGTMSSTHSANPLCCAAAAASFDVIKNEKLVENAAKLGLEIQDYLAELAQLNPNCIQGIFGRGLVFALHIGCATTKQPNAKLAKEIVQACIAQGLLMCNPVGPDAATIKINPPLSIDRSTLNKGCAILKTIIQKYKSIG